MPRASACGTTSDLKVAQSTRLLPSIWIWPARPSARSASNEATPRTSFKGNFVTAWPRLSRCTYGHCLRVSPCGAADYRSNSYVDLKFRDANHKIFLLCQGRDGDGSHQHCVDLCTDVVLCNVFWRAWIDLLRVHVQEVRFLRHAG